MAIATGVGGSVTWPAGMGAGVVDATIFSWTADIQREVHDVTAFGDTGNARVKVGGLMHIVGTCQCYVTSGTLVGPGTMATSDSAPTTLFELHTDNGTDSYDFSAIVSNFNLVVEKRGLAIVTVSFESSGAITFTEA